MKKIHDSLVKHCGILISLGCVLLLISRKPLISRLLSSYFSRYLPYLAAWLRHPSRSPKGRGNANGTNGASLLRPPARPETSGNSGPASPWVLSPASNSRQPGQVRFDPMIAVVPIPSHCEIPPEKRGHLWWQPEDFVNFLRSRLDIAEAYKAAAHSLGVEMCNVTSVGRHAKEAYAATIEAYPSLKDESRRGLGLGRRHQRARNRDAYLAAVVNEQGRQLQFGISDCDALALVARKVSQKDREYAHFLAKMYYEQDHADESDGLELDGRMSNDDSPDSPRRNASLAQIFMEEVEDRSPSREGQSCPRSKGFGLSREKLREVGLSATGHVLSKSQRCRDSLESLADEWSDAGSDFD